MADLVITVPDGAVPRIRAAVGRGALRLGRDATVVEVQQYVREQLKQDVIRLERDRIAATPTTDAAELVNAGFT